MSDIMEITDERENQKKIKTKRSKGVAQTIVKVWELNGFVAHLRKVLSN